MTALSLLWLGFGFGVGPIIYIMALLLTDRDVPISTKLILLSMILAIVLLLTALSIAPSS